MSGNDRQCRWTDRRAPLVAFVNRYRISFESCEIPRTFFRHVGCPTSSVTRVNFDVTDAYRIARVICRIPFGTKPYVSPPPFPANVTNYTVRPCIVRFRHIHTSEVCTMLCGMAENKENEHVNIAQTIILILFEFFWNLSSWQWYMIIRIRYSRVRIVFAFEFVINTHVAADRLLHYKFAADFLNE